MPYSKEGAKSRILRLANNFVENRSKFEKMKETDIRNKLIDPLFESLGWDIDGKEIPDEVIREETIKTGKTKFIDYTFRINGVTKFVVEAKAVSEDLDNSTYIKQVIEYAYNKACLWAVLTDFEGIKIFLVDRDYSETPFYNINLDNVSDFDKNFELLWKFLSREGVVSGELENEAKIRGQLKDKVPIDKQLLDDLMIWRKLLSDDIKMRYSSKYDEETIDEIVQRIIDRLIFIRKTEDMQIEDRILDQVTRREDKYTYGEIKKLFQEFNESYNSKLFGESSNDKHECDMIDISNNVIRKIIKGLYVPTKGKIEYNFAVIDADILGNIYEQYLSFILKKAGRGAKLVGGKAHRKEQGIYYTPTYIVDYIVRNTLGEMLKNGKNPDDIKILDPACGSGSFLLKAFDYLDNYYNKKFGKEKQATLENIEDGLFSRRSKILKNNIFGVDLDSKAVEIAQLNLLLKMAETRRRLPTLRDNIKIGNSLVDDENVASNKAFVWEREFSEVTKNGGFDIVIGNPPYVKARDPKDKSTRDFIENSGKYETVYKMWDLYIAFVERGLKLLKPNGYFGMITPDTIGVADYTQKLVKLINTKYSLYQIDFFPNVEVFSGVGVRNKIIFVKNTEKIKECKRFVHDSSDIRSTRLLDKVNNRDPGVFRLESNKLNLNLKDTIPLGNICYVSYGARFNSDKKDPLKFKKSDLVSPTKDKIHTQIYTEGKYIERYSVRKELFVEWGTERSPKRLVRPTFEELYPQNKILMSRQKRVATISEKGHVCDNTIIVGVPYSKLAGIENSNISKYFKNTKLNRNLTEINSAKFDLKYLLAIINSRLIAYLLRIGSRSKLDSYPDDWKKIPIKIIPATEQRKFVQLVDEIIRLNERLLNLRNQKTDEKIKIEKEIKRIDQEIDDTIYHLYNVDSKTKAIIEESTK